MTPLTPGEPLAMTDTSSGGRPRAKTMVRLDLYNAYARLGVSPLLPTDEIKEVINRKRKEVMRQRRTRGEQQFGEEEAEMTRLQAIEDEIGTPNPARYDRLNPQNALLTIQPGRQMSPRFQAPRRLWPRPGLLNSSAAAAHCRLLKA